MGRTTTCIPKALLIFLFSALPIFGQIAPSPDSAPSPNGPASATDQRIQRLQRRLKESPLDFAAQDALGSAFFQKARESGDISYYDLAEQTLKKAIDLAPADFRAADPLVHMALVCMGEHRFTDALSYAQRAISLGSGNLSAFAIEGDAFTDLGDYDEAESAYAAMQRLARAVSTPSMLAYMNDSRIAYLRFLHGDTAGAIALMKNAIGSALNTNMPRENLAWLYFELGERYFQNGDLDNAALAFQSGIGADPSHYRSLGGLAKVRAAQGELDQSIQLYQRSLAIIPFPAYIEELGDVYRKLGREKEALQRYELVEYIGHLSELNQVLTNRELALFYADRGIKLKEALDLARKEFQVRHDIYTWDTLAWALYKNGQLQDAAEAERKAQALHTSDPLLLFHAGMISHAMARDSEAADFLSRALKINPHFHVLHAELASRTLKEIAQNHRNDLRSSNAN